MGEDNRFCFGHVEPEVQWSIQEICVREEFGNLRCDMLFNLQLVRTKGMIEIVQEACEQ